MRGVDLGGNKIAYVDLARGIYAEYVGHAAVTNRYQRLHQARSWLGHFPNGNKVWVEAPILGGNQNAQTLIQIAQMTALAQMQWPDTELVPPPKWKKAVVGKGNATKLEVAAWLRKNEPKIHERVERSQDLIDASCIAIYGRLHG